ncbi:MAG TPA: hypothetical protein P5540_19765 [Candidatus Hydrogenedentes bacterium]|nr:hypothetical protein [Candidatus Hydrogenedentota bacterium]
MPVDLDSAKDFLLIGGGVITILGVFWNNSAIKQSLARFDEFMRENKSVAIELRQVQKDTSELQKAIWGNGKKGIVEMINQINVRCARAKHIEGEG